MATTTTSRTPWLLVLGVLLAVAAAALITFTDLAWRGLIGWPLLLVALLLVVSGGIRRGQQRRSTHRI
ncbi:putative integral membrane protein [Kocuria rhizophila]|uniref:hypothetical protein n=1 Tax=Kocuria rhizophila TaxID=72000 RepID=UPI0028577DA8|nr:hypothetical protein [Kocuria rhizophila]MDR7373410.1 putative integral membrane protein [Kocuria rhizophila]